MKAKHKNLFIFTLSSFLLASLFANTLQKEAHNVEALTVEKVVLLDGGKTTASPTITNKKTGNIGNDESPIYFPNEDNNELTENTTFLINGFSYNFTLGAKHQESQGTNRLSTNGTILLKGNTSSISNITPFGNGITKLEIFSNKGSSSNEGNKVGVVFGSSFISEYASPTWEEKINTVDKIYEITSLPENSPYFMIKAVGSKNSQIQVRITYQEVLSPIKEAEGYATYFMEKTNPACLDPNNYNKSALEGALWNDLEIKFNALSTEAQDLVRQINDTMVGASTLAKEAAKRYDHIIYRYSLSNFINRQLISSLPATRISNNNDVVIIIVIISLISVTLLAYLINKKHRINN